MGVLNVVKFGPIVDRGGACSWTLGRTGTPSQPNGKNRHLQVDYYNVSTYVSNVSILRSIITKSPTFHLEITE